MNRRLATGQIWTPRTSVKPELAALAKDRGLSDQDDMVMIGAQYQHRPKSAPCIYHPKTYRPIEVEKEPET